jgi:hypothetical protein
MSGAFEAGFFGELRACLTKLAEGRAEAGQPLLSKMGGVASGMARVYETMAPSAEQLAALRYVTPRFDAHKVGRAAGKLLARGKTGFGDAVATGRRSAETGRGVLEKGAGDAPSGGELAAAMGDIESLEHRVRHPAERRAVHEAGRAIARERTRALHKNASPFGQLLQVLAGQLVRR